MRSTNSTPSSTEAADPRPGRGSLPVRLRDERGFFSGSLIEPLMCIPMLTLITLAAFFLLNDTMKSQARTRSQTLGHQHAQRAFDSVARDLRSATKIVYKTPTAMCGGCGSYATGETNTVEATMVVRSAGLEPRQVTYTCAYGFGLPNCAKLFRVGDPPPTSGTQTVCQIFPAGGLQSGNTYTGNGECNGWTYGNLYAAADADKRYNDIVFPTYDLGVFQFRDYLDNPVAMADGGTADAVEFHPNICLRSASCDSAGAKRPLVLATTIRERNRAAPSVDDDVCNNEITGDEPDPTITNPGWVGPGDPDADGNDKIIPNPEAC